MLDWRLPAHARLRAPLRHVIESPSYVRVLFQWRPSVPERSVCPGASMRYPPDDRVILYRQYSDPTGHKQPSQPKCTKHLPSSVIMDKKTDPEPMTTLKLDVEDVGRTESNLYVELRMVIEDEHKLPSLKVEKPEDVTDWLAKFHNAKLSEDDFSQLAAAFKEHVGSVFHVDLEDKYVYLKIYSLYDLDDETNGVDKSNDDNVANGADRAPEPAPENVPVQPKRKKPKFSLLGPHSPRTEQRIAEIAQQTRAVLDDALSTMSLEEYAAQYDAYMQSCDLTQ